LFSAPEIFIPDVGLYGTKNRRRKLAPETGVDLWRRFLERVSWAWPSSSKAPSNCRHYPTRAVSVSARSHSQWIVLLMTLDFFGDGTPADRIAFQPSTRCRWRRRYVTRMLV